MTNYTDLRKTDLYTDLRDALSYVASDRLHVFESMADTDTKRLAVSDEIASRVIDLPAR
jgi:hypothetical protein